MELNVILTATQWQQEIINCKSRIVAVFAGRRAGKSKGILRNVGLKNCLARPRYRALYVAPGYSQSKIEFEEISQHVAVRKFISKSREQPYPSIRFTNGSFWGFRSLDRPHLLRSGGFDLLEMDEVQDIPEEVYQRVLRALVADRRGQIFMAGQFNGESGWLHKKIYQPGQIKDQKKITSWIIPSSMGPNFLTPEGIEELADIKAQLPHIVWDQEYMCLPVANIRAVFDPVDIDLCVAGELEQNPEVGCKYVVSLDMGRTADPNSYVVLKVKGTEITVIESGVRPLREKHEDGAVLMAKTVSRFGNCCFVCDTTGGATGGHGPIDAHTKFYRTLIPSIREIWFGPIIKQQVISTMDLWLQQHKINIPAAHEELIRQLKLYEYKHIQGSVAYTYNAPQGDHDDLCFHGDSLILTSDGEIPIKNIMPGTLVLTRKGWNKVTAAQQTGIKSLYQIGNLTGTPNHPFFCVNRNMYLRLDALGMEDEVLTCQRKSLSLMECGLLETMRHAIDAIENISGRIIDGKVHQFHCIDISGQKRMGQFLKDMLSIIRTETGRTISSKTLNASQWEHTTKCLRLLAELQNLDNNQLIDLLNYGEIKNIWQDNMKFINPNLVNQNVQNLLGECGIKENIGNLSVRNVLLNSLRAMRDGLTFVAKDVANAPGQSCLDIGHDQPVYNLTIENDAEYFCQGVLVHNCTALGMAIWAIEKNWMTMAFGGSLPSAIY